MALSWLTSRPLWTIHWWVPVTLTQGRQTPGRSPHAKRVCFHTPVWVWRKTRPSASSQDSRILSSTTIDLYAVSCIMSPRTDYQVQITEIHNLRTIVLRGCSQQSLSETGWKSKNPTNTCSSAEMLESYIDKLGDFKSITFNGLKFEGNKLVRTRRKPLLDVGVCHLHPGIWTERCYPSFMRIPALESTCRKQRNWTLKREKLVYPLRFVQVSCTNKQPRPLSLSFSMMVKQACLPKDFSWG